MKLLAETWPKETQRAAKSRHGHRLTRSCLARRPEVTSYQCGHEFSPKCSVPATPRVSVGGRAHKAVTQHPEKRTMQPRKVDPPVCRPGATEATLRAVMPHGPTVVGWRACRHVRRPRHGRGGAFLRAGLRATSALSGAHKHALPQPTHWRADSTPEYKGCGLEERVVVEGVGEMISVVGSAAAHHANAFAHHHPPCRWLAGLGEEKGGEGRGEAVKRLVLLSSPARPHKKLVCSDYTWSSYLPTQARCSLRLQPPRRRHCRPSTRPQSTSETDVASEAHYAGAAEISL